MRRFVLDTNALLRIVKKDGTYYIAWKQFHAGKYQICVTNDILLEYEEILKAKIPQGIAESIVNQLKLSKNVIRITPKFHMDLIPNDIDDNKFVDCAIAANAEYIVSNDKHFNVLKN